MELIIKKIYEDFIKRKSSKNETIELLINFIENGDNDNIRNDCIQTLNKFDFNHSNVFKILEQILISESNEQLRYSAARVIKNKFIDIAQDSFIWTLQHESCYDILITAINSLEEMSDPGIISILIDQIKKNVNEKILDGFKPIFLQEIMKQSSPEKLKVILINLITINYLLNKFETVYYKSENGFITELDFSKVDKKIINWHDREIFQTNSDIIGIVNLKKLKNLKFLPETWILKNEYTFVSTISLIETLERLNNDLAKQTLISQVKTIRDNKFVASIQELLNLHLDFENISLSKLSEIWKNYLTIAFFKKRYPSTEYSLEKGEVISFHIENEPLTTIPDFIKHFQSIRSLSLKRCKLYTLPESIGLFKHLENLDLQKNNLKVIPESLSSLISLKSLNLSNNQITHLPSSVGNLTSLRFLNLESNNLTAFPGSIGHLTLLKELDISKNKIKIVPSSIGALKSLKLLNLNNNNIKYLPRSIGLLYSLETLRIDNNNLEYIPDSINSLNSLKIINLEANELKDIPESLSLLKSLETLKLGWNKIQKLPYTIGTLNSLKYLYLNDNEITEFPNCLCNLYSLEILDISDNKLKILPDDFGQLSSLKNLKLKSDYLEKIHYS